MDSYVANIYKNKLLIGATNFKNNPKTPKIKTKQSANCGQILKTSPQQQQYNKTSLQLGGYFFSKKATITQQNKLLIRSQIIKTIPNNKNKKKLPTGGQIRNNPKQQE